MDEGNGIHRHAMRDSRVREGPWEKVEDGKRGKGRDERWKPPGGGDVQVDGRSAPRRVEGRSGCNREIGTASNDDIWGEVGVGMGGGGRRYIKWLNQVGQGRL